jgi:hypothetical protein
LVLIVEAVVVGFVLVRERGTPEGRQLLRSYALAVVTGFVLILPWYVYGSIEWIPHIRAGKSYRLNPEGQFAVPLDTDLFKRAAGWLLGNATNMTPLVIALVVLLVAAPLLARGRSRVVAGFALAYTLGFMLVLVPLARALGTYFAYRRVESFVPPLLLLVAIALVGIVDRLDAIRIPRPFAYGVGAVAVAVLVGLSFSATASYYDTEKTNFRAFARVVAEAPAGQDIVSGPATARSARYIRSYLHWKGVDRHVTFLIRGALPAVSAVPPDGVTWLTGSPPNRPDMQTRSLNDLRSMQVIGGDRSGLLVILPWFASTSRPSTVEELTQQRDAVAGLGVFLPAPK